MLVKEKILEDLFFYMLKDIFYVEKQILKVLLKMVKNVELEELVKVFEIYCVEMEGQIECLEKVFEMFGKLVCGVQCEVINGIIEEGKEVMEDFVDSEVFDVGILVVVQVVEYYEIICYGFLKIWVQEFGMGDVVKFLDQNFQEEKKIDQFLIQFVEVCVNIKVV